MFPDIERRLALIELLDQPDPPELHRGHRLRLEGKGGSVQLVPASSPRLSRPNCLRCRNVPPKTQPRYRIARQYRYPFRTVLAERWLRIVMRVNIARAGSYCCGAEKSPSRSFS